MGCPRPNVPNKNAKLVSDLAEPLRSIVHTIQIDAAAVGRRVGLTSGARSAGQQWDLRHGRVPAGQECNPAYKGVPTTAVPGRSRHENTGPDWCAADLNGDLSWVHQRAADYGIHFPVAGEAWHAQPTGRKPRARIIPWGRPAPAPATWSPPVFPGIIRDGSPASKVAPWRVVLGACGYKGFKVGVHPWSRTLGAATRRFQRRHGLEPDGVVGSITWAKAVEVLRDKRRRKGLPT